MKKSTLSLTLLAASALTLASCASIKGTVYKQKSGDFKATYSAKTEAEALKVVHEDAKLTCKNNGGKTPAVVDEKITSLTEDTKEAGEGFSAVAGSAVSAIDKYFTSTTKSTFV